VKTHLRISPTSNKVNKDANFSFTQEAASLYQQRSIRDFSFATMEKKIKKDFITSGSE